MNEKIYFCLKHTGLIRSDTEVFTSPFGECYVCGEQSACYIEYPVEIEIPAERLAILE
jgi:hypothetical protein